MEKYFLSICTVIRNEGPYFEEWVRFHRLQGVEHFYIYLNSSVGEDLETNAVVLKQQEIGKDITIVRQPGKRQQCICFQHCLQVFGHESEWIAFIDTDEFLWSPTIDNVQAVLRIDWFKHLTKENTAGIAVHWVMFGSNGHKEKTDGLVIERFTRRAGSVNNHVKSIVRPRYIKSCGSDPHSFLPKEGFTIIDERGVVLPPNYANSTTGSADILRINHYHTKSRAEFFSRKLGNPDANSARKYNHEQVEQMFLAHDLNEVEDTELKDRYAESLK